MSSKYSLRLNGYEDLEGNILSLQQISITAGADALTNLAAFIASCAEEMRQNNQFDHKHFLDFMKCDEDLPDIVILAEQD